LKLAFLISLMLLAPSTQHLTIQHEGKTIEDVSRSDYEMAVGPFINTDNLDKLLERLDRQVYRKPQNAVIGQQGEIISEQMGRKLDQKKFMELMGRFFFEGGPATIELPTLPLHPRVDAELLAFIREKPIGGYITYFNPRNRNRSNNIELAAKAINNTVVFQGESFSFNNVVGMRTKEKGYMRAPVIVRGELAEDVGGGICQVSSTLFNAIDRAGLRVVQRYSHSRSISYVPAGRDATVSWGGPDLVFQNVYVQPILIRAFAGNGALYVTIYSSEAIDFIPREVPRVSNKLPEEIEVQLN